jgi:hypothetical protein
MNVRGSTAGATAAAKSLLLSFFGILAFNFKQSNVNLVKNKQLTSNHLTNYTDML